MDTGRLEKYLHDHIPLSAAMAVEVLDASEDEVVLGAPLAPNINHRDTAFGGSVSALAILAAWSLVHVRLSREGKSCRIVIQRNTMDYDAPILGEFTARATLAAPDRWPAFLRLLERRGLARVRVTCVLESGGADVGKFEGAFVAMDMDRLAAGE